MTSGDWPRYRVATGRRYCRLCFIHRVPGGPHSRDTGGGGGGGGGPWLAMALHCTHVYT